MPENQAIAKKEARTGAPLQSSLESFYISSDFPQSYDFPYNPEPLASGNNYDIYDEMRRDDQVRAALSVKKNMVLSSGWHIVCDDEKIKEFVTESLKNSNSKYLGETFESCLWDMLSAYDYGFSLAEVIYRLDGSLYNIDAVKVRPPHTFRFNIDDKGNVVTVEQTGKSGVIKFGPDKFLHFAVNPEFGNPYGNSDLVAAHPAYKAKKFFLRMYAMYCERFATPTVVGRYESTMDDGEIQRLHSILKTIQQNTTLTIPKDLEITFEQATRDASTTFSDGIDLFNMWIARAILVPDLMGVSGSKTEGGSYALGTKQFAVFMASINKDRNALEAAINRKIIKPLVSANFGDIKCEFQFMGYDESDEAQLMDLWIRAASAKLFKPNEDEINYFRRNTGFPEGDVIEISQPVYQPEPRQFSEKKPESKKYSRELYPCEKKVNFADIEKTLDSAEKRISDAIEPVADKIIVDLAEQVKDKNIVSDFKPEKVNTIQPKYQKEMNRILKTYFNELFNKSVAGAKKELFPSGDKHFLDSEILPEEFLTVIEAEAFRTVGDYSTEMTKRAKNVVMNGIKAGLGEGEIVKRIKDDVREASETWLQTVIRTKTTEIYNSARKTYWETDKLAKELVSAYEYSAIIDDRTSDVCRELDGKIFEKGEFIDKVTPPLHFSCRSILVPVTRFEDYTPAAEPSIDSLKEMGGNLIA